MQDVSGGNYASYCLLYHDFIRCCYRQELWKADELFDELLLLGLVPEVCTCNVYVNGLCKQNNIEAELEMISCVEQQGYKPNLITYNI